MKKNFIFRTSITAIMTCFCLLGCSSKKEETSSEVIKTNEEIIMDIRDNLPEGIEVPKRESEIEDLVFKKTEEKELKMKIEYSTAQVEEKAKVLFLITGGGFHTGTRNDMLSFVNSELPSFRNDNYTVCSIDYRLYGDSVSFSQLISDCMDGLRYLYVFQKELNIDVKNINVCGHSAGGFLVLAVSSFDQNLFYKNSPYKGVKYSLRKVAALSPVVSLHDVNGVAFLFDQPCQTAINGLLQREDFDFDIENLCPFDQIKEDMPPILLVHGTGDELVNYQASNEYVNKAKSLNARITFLSVTNGMHDYSDKDTSRKSSMNLPTVCQKVHEFIKA